MTAKLNPFVPPRSAALSLIVAPVASYENVSDACDGAAVYVEPFQKKKDKHGKVLQHWEAVPHT